jgi:hypothetical protein
LLIVDNADVNEGSGMILMMVLLPMMELGACVNINTVVCSDVIAVL